MFIGAAYSCQLFLRRKTKGALPDGRRVRRICVSVFAAAIWATIFWRCLLLFASGYGKHFCLFSWGCFDAFLAGERVNPRHTGRARLFF